MAKPPSKNDIDSCRRCQLWERATQGVAGEGPRDARLMLVGEQPGDAEDREGRPFVGAAGGMLRKGLEEAGIAPEAVYITNAVKHFSWEPRGIRRIHKTPAQREIAACHAWLDGEIAAIRPACIVALGVTALSALVGKRMTLSAARDSPPTLPGGAALIATYHPSALLRAPEEARRDELYALLVADLRRAAAAAGLVPAGRKRR
jgi:DNA polymerase